MSTVKLRYIGTADRYFDNVTGSRQEWLEGSSSHVDSSIVSALLATGYFERVYAEIDAAAVAAAMGGGFIYQRLNSLFARAKNANPFDLSVMASPPTVTVGAAALSNPVAYNYFDTNGYKKVFILGVPPGDASLMIQNNSGRAEGKTLTGSNNTFSNSMKGYLAKVKITAQKVQFDVQGLSAALLRFRVDNALVSAAGTSAGTTNVQLDFGSRQTHEIGIEFEQAQALKGIIVDQDDTVYSWDDLPEPVVYLGDSYLNGSMSPQVTGTSGLGGQTFPSALRDISGWNVIAQGCPASGWLAGVPLTDPYRLAFAAAAINQSGAKLCNIRLGTNDVSNLQSASITAAQITAAAGTVLDYLLANTSAKITLGGSWPKNLNLSSALLATDAAILAAVAARDQSRVGFVDVNGINGGLPWVTGAKDTATGTGAAGNSVYVTGDDHVHPSAYGTEYLARKDIDATLAVCKSKNW